MLSELCRSCIHNMWKNQQSWDMSKSLFLCWFFACTICHFSLAFWAEFWQCWLLKCQRAKDQPQWGPLCIYLLQNFTASWKLWPQWFCYNKNRSCFLANPSAMKWRAVTQLLWTLTTFCLERLSAFGSGGAITAERFATFSCLLFFSKVHSRFVVGALGWVAYFLIWLHGGVGGKLCTKLCSWQKMVRNDQIFCSRQMAYHLYCIIDLKYALASLTFWSYAMFGVGCCWYEADIVPECTTFFAHCLVQLKTKTGSLIHYKMHHILNSNAKHVAKVFW